MLRGIDMRQVQTDNPVNQLMEFSPPGQHADDQAEDRQSRHMRWADRAERRNFRKDPARTADKASHSSFLPVTVMP